MHTPIHKINERVERFNKRRIKDVMAYAARDAYEQRTMPDRSLTHEMTDYDL